MNIRFTQTMLPRKVVICKLRIFCLWFALLWQQMECCIKCKCSSFKTDGLKTGDEQEKGQKNDERLGGKKASVKIWKRQICLVYEKEDGGVNLSQPFSTNMVVGKVVNRVQFQHQSQFSGTKRKKVNNLSCLLGRKRWVSSQLLRYGETPICLHLHPDT